MPLFVVKHQHTDETCPARNPEMGGMLLTYLSPENSEKFGIDIKSEAVINGKHTLYLILESESEEQIKKFMEPFAQNGSVEIMPASMCEIVVDRGSC